MADPTTLKSTLIAFPPSQKIHQVDQKGNIAAVRLSLDPKNFCMGIEKLNFSVPPTPSTPFTPLANPFSPNSPMSPSTTRFSFRWTLRRRNTSSGYSSGTPSVSGEEQIQLLEVDEIRLSNYNAKTLKLSSQALKELKPIASGSRKNFMNKYKVIQILFGKEFNLKCHTFLVIELTEFGKQQKDNQSPVKGWVDQLENLTNEIKVMGYYDKLELWYRKQFEMTVYKNTDNHRLKIWRQFLHRSHHRISMSSLQHEYEFIEQHVREQLPGSCTGRLENSEFYLISRLFVHSASSISTIFDQFTPGIANDLLRLQVQSLRTEDELNENDVLREFYSMFKSYFAYVHEHGVNLPEISSEMDRASVYTKDAIRMFADRIRVLGDDRLIQEKWLCSNYILDYLFSLDNSIWMPDTTKQYQDMTKPLSYYWINSSHNTYLTGDQYSSESSVEAYVRALRYGCRCLEIDVWNGPFGKPIVTHGRTLTTAVKLKDVLMTIKEHAFTISPYPVIISIENHCDLKQQKVMTKYFRNTFGKMLVNGPLPDSTCAAGSSEIAQLPSPDQLKHKIILKARKLPFAEENKNRSTTASASEVDDADKEQNFDPPKRQMLTADSSSTLASTQQDANPCDCLITGELWRSNDSGTWIPCIFILTNKKMFYMEKQNEGDDAGQLPNYMRHRNLMMSRSVSSAESNLDLHNDQLWYHGKMPGGRQAADLLLEQHAVHGSFLVRESETTEGHTLCFYYETSNNSNDQRQFVNHCHIFTRNLPSGLKAHFLTQNPKDEEMFHSIFELIEYYMRHPLVTQKCQLKHLGNPVPPSISHEAEEYFYKHMDRKASEKVLEKLPINGAFLGRYRTEYPGEIVISFRYELVIKHCHIKREGRYLTVSNLKFIKLEDLVDHYSKNPFYKTIKLGHPVGKELFAQSQQSDCVQRVYACAEYLNSTVKTVKGRVRAIQSFNTTDSGYLSFRKGEVIVNVIKEPDGWWWGTREDAVGDEALIPKQFPQSFVEDIEELEECPFGDYINNGTWRLGCNAKVKMCTDKNAKQQGIKYYISFKYSDGTKRKLAASCSKRKANEWVELINHVIEHDEDSKKALAKSLVSEKFNITSEFSDLIFHCCSMDKKICADNYSWDKNKINVRLTKSLDELTGDRLFRTNPSFFTWYHQYALTRIYPKGFRFNSSNPSPARFWNFGSQMVALNFQTPDKAMQWNRGKFRQNGNVGYVLKPDCILPGDKMREDGSSSELQFDPTRLNEEGFCRVTCLRIQVISARHLGKQSSGHVTPLVEIEVVGVDADCRKVKTCSQETGLNPYWNETFDLNLRCPELALIQFSVCDMDTFSDRLLLGEATIPFPCIRTGYRSIQLHNAYGTPLFSTLLVHVGITERDSIL